MRAQGNGHTFLKDLEALRHHAVRGGPSWLAQLRGSALSRFAQLGFPTTRQEEWRFTDVTPLTSIAFRPVYRRPNGLAPDVPGWSVVRSLPGPRLVLVDGRFEPRLSELAAAGGVVVDSLAAALEHRPEALASHLARYARWEDHPFVALNTGLSADGAFVYLPAGVCLEEPIQLVHLWTAAAEARVAHPRHLILAGPRSRAAVVESYWGPDGTVSFTNQVTEMVLGPKALLEHCKLQCEGDGAFHMATLEVHQQRESRFTSHTISLGGSLVRNELNVRLDGPESECTLNGLYWARGAQHMDLRTRIDHAQTACRSEQLYKGILDGRARGVFNGKIYVHPAGQKTDAKQTNRALVLSEDARVNTKPQLEIFADEVRCTHGATVGQLDAEAMFYLRSRGIPLPQARQLLIFAFANDVVGRIPVGPLRAELERFLMPHGPSTTNRLASSET